MRRTHLIQFRNPVCLTLHPPQGSSGKTTELKVRKGHRARVQLKPLPVTDDLIERADLAFADGTEATAVKYADFRFVDIDSEDDNKGKMI